ncbi:MAG: glutaredoxin 3 [Pseudomonadota bacterium]|nr:glutaredoxin 3 [Pseudomonadota bacterium]
MPDIEIYTTALCPYCHAAKRLLGEMGAAFREIDVTFDPARRAEMRERSGGRSTVPQVFVNGKHVGGCDDLYALQERGELEALLKSGAGAVQ